MKKKFGVVKHASAITAMNKTQRNSVVIALVLLLVLVVSLILRFCTRTNKWPAVVVGIPFCIIHITSRKDREKNAHRSLTLAGRAGFTPVNRGAIVGYEELRVNPFLDMTKFPNEMRTVLRKGEVGCFHSHQASWYLGRDRGALVCEDDAILNDDCLIRMSDAIRYVSDVLKVRAFVIHGRYSAPRSLTEKCRNNYITPELQEVKCPCYNTNLYFASAAACDLFCQVASDPMYWMPVDDFLSSLSGCHPTRVIDQTILAFAITPAGLNVMRTRSDTN